MIKLKKFSKYIDDDEDFLFTYGDGVSNININNFDPKKRPLAAVADNNEIRNIVNVKVKINKKINFKLLFNPKESLIQKIKLEQKIKTN